MKHPDVGPYNFITDSVVWTRGLFLLFFITLSVNLSGQEKGKEGLVPQTQGKSGSTTRAVVVGISDYQHPDIPDLRFANRDAEMFVRYLLSKSGGSLIPENIRLLVDSVATSARFESELDWLLVESIPGDQAIIYFSGHGDVEQKYGNSGFLLCHDASPKLYGSTGAFGIGYLKSLVQSFTEKRVKIILITDACRAGKLAGSPIGGPNLTAAAMREQFANEIKLMACQPNEMSMESPTLGKGQGVFSYYLIRGLTGEGDEDGDLRIKLGELTRYLTSNVSKEVAPLFQNPVTSGDAEVTISIVDTSDVFYKQELKGNNLDQLSYYTERGYEEVYFHRLDTLHQKLISTFNELVEKKIFLDPPEHYADTYYNLIQSDPQIQEEFKRYIKRNYAVALQDDIQQALLAILDANLTSGPETRIMVETYRNYPRQIARSAEILGTKHMMYKNLKAREKWLEGFLIYGNNNQTTDKLIGQMAINKFQESLALEPNSPVVHYYMALTYLKILQEPDSALLHVRLANNLAATWTLPNAQIATYLMKAPYSDFSNAQLLLNEAMEMDSTSLLVWRGLGALAYYQADDESAEVYFRKILEYDSTNATSWSNLAAVLINTNRNEETESFLIEGIRRHPDVSHLRYVYGCLLSITGRKELAIESYTKALSINEKHKSCRDSLANLLFKVGRVEESIAEWNEMLRLNPDDVRPHYSLALIYLSKNELTKAKSHLEKYFIARNKLNHPPKLEAGIDQFIGIPAFKDILEHYLTSKSEGQ